MSTESLINVRIPTPLRNLTAGRDVVAVTGSTIRDVIENLEKDFGGIRERLCEPDGRIRPYVRVFLNDEDVRFLQSGETPVQAGDTVTILPAIAGGLR